MAASDTGILIICLHSENGSNSWKELIKMIIVDLGTTLTESIVAEIFSPEDTSKLLSQHFEPLSINFEAL